MCYTIAWTPKKNCAPEMRGWKILTVELSGRRRSFYDRKQTKLAAFMLHQAAGQCLHALFEINSEMYLNTHSIEKLLRYACMACYHLPEIFPRNNDKEEKLFQLLQKAYISVAVTSRSIPSLYANWKRYGIRRWK